jgi:hypothetical protein
LFNFNALFMFVLVEILLTPFFFKMLQVSSTHRHNQLFNFLFSCTYSFFFFLDRPGFYLKNLSRKD